MMTLSQWRCDRKQAYELEWKATRAAKLASKKSGELIISYECFECGAFHIGHADQSQILAREPKMPQSCRVCLKPMPLDKLERGKHYGQRALYCSRGCQRAAAKARKTSTLSDSKPLPEK